MTNDGVSLHIRAGSAFIRAEPAPATMARLTAGDRELLDTLAEHLAEVRALEEHAAALVLELRSRGVPWSVIGWASGLTDEGARRRWWPGARG